MHQIHQDCNNYPPPHQKIILLWPNTSSGSKMIVAVYESLMPHTFSINATQILRIKGNMAMTEKKLANMISNLIQIVFPRDVFKLSRLLEYYPGM